MSLVALAGLALAGCGSSPSSPSGSGGVTVQGVLLGEGATVSASSAGSGTSAGPITVVVEGTSITTTISGNGTFELEGLPAGTFTLVFLRDGSEIGRVQVTAGDGFDVKIVVKIEDAVVVLVDLQLEDRNGPRDGSGSASTASCLIDGGKVGARIELEGTVQAGSGNSFAMATDGNRAGGLVAVDASAASYKCNGKTGPDCRASLGTGDKVHVRGTLSACTASDATVTATEVKVQKSAGS